LEENSYLKLKISEIENLRLKSLTDLELFEREFQIKFKSKERELISNIRLLEEEVIKYFYLK